MILAYLFEPPRRVVNGLYGAARPGVEWLARRIFDAEITGRENVPVQGPVVVAANHLSFLDPVMVALAIRRNVRFLALDFLFNRSLLFDSLVACFGTIPISHEVAPIRAMRHAVSELQKGEVVGAFPEGRRVARWREVQPDRGAGWLALATGAKLVPVALQGTQGTMGIVDRRVRPTPVRIWLEKPLDILNYIDTPDPAQAIMRDWYTAIDQRLAPWWGSSTC